MGWFTKKRDSAEVLDIVALQKKGLLKQKQQSPSAGIATDAYGYADLSSSAASSSSSALPSSTSDFFSGFGSSSSASQSSQNTPTDFWGNPIQPSTTSTTPAPISSSGSDLNYGLENISRKLSDIMDRMEVVEKRLNRIEGR